LPALRRTLFAFGALAVAFMAFSAVVAAGTMHSLDVDVSRAMTEAWREQLHAAFQGLALFGGLELSTVVAALLGLWMWRRRFGVDSLAVLAFPVAVVLELVYKRIVNHPGPPLNIAHADGPSFSELLGQGVAAGSFPSGHVVRTVVAYGLLAFVIARLAHRRWVGRLAVAGAVLLIAAECFDRLYLNVHWESDVIGGLLLGGVALAGAIIWLDRPWAST
jgi:membrane-associated phospholipid phosphatase